MRTIVIEDVKLVMFERTMMPESNAVKQADGKTSFIKTGKEIEMTTYTFRDGFGEKLVFLTKTDAYRAFEGELVKVTLDVKFNDFTKKNQVFLAGVEKVTPKAK